MRDLREGPDRTAAQRHQNAATGALTPSDGWACMIVPDPPAAMLLVTRQSASPARAVQVLLDGKPARQHPAVVVDANVPNEMSLGAELEYRVVLQRGEPLFDMLEVRWVDERGQRHTYRCTDVRQEL